MLPLSPLDVGFGFGGGFSSCGGGIALTSLSAAATSFDAVQDSRAVGGVTVGGLQPYPASRTPSSGAQRGSACLRMEAEAADEEDEEEEEEEELIERDSHSSG